MNETDKKPDLEGLEDVQAAWVASNGWEQAADTKRAVRRVRWMAWRMRAELIAETLIGITGIIVSIWLFWKGGGPAQYSFAVVAFLLSAIVTAGAIKVRLGALDYAADGPLRLVKVQIRQKQAANKYARFNLWMMPVMLFFMALALWAVVEKHGSFDNEIVAVVLWTLIAAAVFLVGQTVYFIWSLGKRRREIEALRLLEKELMEEGE